MSSHRIAAIRRRVKAVEAEELIKPSTWEASYQDEGSSLPPETTYVVEEVASTGTARFRSSVGVFGSDAHATFTASARKDVPWLLAEVQRLEAAKRILLRSLEARARDIGRLHTAAQGVLDADTEAARERLRNTLSDLTELADFGTAGAS